MSEEGKQKSTDDIYNLLKDILEQNKELKAQNSEICNQNKIIQENIKTLKESLTLEIDVLKDETENLKEENKLLKTKLHVVEKKLKKFNIIIYGVQESQTTALEVVIDIIRNQLQLTCNYQDIRDAFRLSNTSTDRGRPILAELSTIKLKTDILENAKKLKGSGVYISLDYTPEEWEKRKYLNKHLKQAREKKYSAKIKNNKLFVNGEVYTYEELKNTSINPVDLLPYIKSHSEPTTPKIDNKNTEIFPDSAKRKFEDSPEKPTGTIPKKPNHLKKNGKKAVPQEHIRTSSRTRQQ